MDRREFLVRTALTPAALSLVARAVADESPALPDGPWVQLFNGKNLEGWTPKIKGYELGDNYADTFRVEDGVLKIAYDKYEGPFRGRFGHLFYKDEFSHYVLRVEYRVVGEQAERGPGWAIRNSGVMIHGQKPEMMRKDQDFPVCLEVQLLGGNGQNPRPTGNLCTPGTNVVYQDKLHTQHCTNSTSDTFAGDQWVTCEIEVHGGRLIRHKINGQEVIAYSEPQLDEADADAQRLLADGTPKMLTGGTISLQSESHPVEFRKVEIMQLAGPKLAAGGEPVELADPASFTLVALPDTQVYAMHEKWNHHFYNQAEWIAQNTQRLNIKYVLHEGDIVNNNNRPQWEVAQAAMKRLHGVVPYALAPGNHDFGKNGSSDDRFTYLNEYFSAAGQAKWPTFGGVKDEGRLESSYHTFEAQGKKYLILALEWGPRDETVAWANKVCDEHPDHRIILVTHAFIYYDSTRYDWKKYGDKQTWNPHNYTNCKPPVGTTNDGEELWQKLIRQRPNFLMTLNGHVLEDGAGRLSTAGDHGNMVHQMLANYQNREEGGQGFLRLIEFLPDDKTVRVRSYSPSTGTFKTDDEQQFALTLEHATA